MSVSSSFAIPGQPPTGALHYTPLGGDGLSAPFAAVNIVGFKVTGDASAGNATLTANLDTRFVSLVAFMVIQIVQATSADADARYVLSTNPARAAGQIENRVIASTSLLLSTVSIADTWNLIPQLVTGIDNPRLSATFKNVADDGYFMDAVVYQFRLDVREKYPMGPLLWSRGST